MSTFYIDFASGSDSNTSAQAQSQATPWKHCPGMLEATGAAAAYSVQVGDVFVLKGGVTWTFSTNPLYNNGYINVPSSGVTIMGGQQLGTPWGSGFPIIQGTGTNLLTVAGINGQN